MSAILAFFLTTISQRNWCDGYPARRWKHLQHLIFSPNWPIYLLARPHDQFIFPKLQLDVLHVIRLYSTAFEVLQRCFCSRGLTWLRFLWSMTWIKTTSMQYVPDLQTDIHHLQSLIWYQGSNTTLDLKLSINRIQILVYRFIWGFQLDFYSLQVFTVS